jgi:UDP-N-acetylmuramoyl-tripeptide--D-alanyl-D-alanine ligase
MSGGFTWTDAEVRQALGLGTGQKCTPAKFSGVTTDSRQVCPDDLYVALIGEKFDGHDFVGAAVAGGATGAVVSRSAAGPDGVAFYRVDDTLIALGLLAAHRRAALSVPVVGITGSNGKTSTKDFTRGALESSFTVHATTGNLNNRIGLPMTLLATPDDAQVVVVEMGSNEPGEIRTLTGIARPTHGIITTVSESHLEKLGSVAGVLSEKLDLVRGLPPEGAAVVGDDPPVLPASAKELHPRTRVSGWSQRADADLRPVHVTVDAGGQHSFDWRGERVTLAGPGRHLVQNALLALTVAELFAVEPGVAAAGVSSVRPGWMRGQVEDVGGLTLLLDCYNANPLSVKAALDLLELQTEAPRRVAVLGSMLELGEQSQEFHADTLRDALTRKVDLVVAIGAFAAAASHVPGASGGPAVLAAESPLAAYARLKEHLIGDEVVLLKASRGVELESIIPKIREDFGHPNPAEGSEGTH